MVLETVTLTDAADSQLGTFSGGMHQRTGIAQALLNDPELLVVDEPTVGLDREKRVRMRNALADTAKAITRSGLGLTSGTGLDLLSGLVAKAGGVPWRVADLPGEADVLVGLDITRDADTGQRVGASAAVIQVDGTMFASRTQW